MKLTKLFFIAFVGFALIYGVYSTAYQKGLQQSEDKVNELTEKVIKYQSEEEKGGAVLEKFVIAESTEGNIYIQLKDNSYDTMLTSYDGGGEYLESNWILLQPNK